MKKILTILFILLSFTYTFAGNKYTMLPGGDKGKFIGPTSAAAYHGGDTLVLSSHNGNWSYFTVDGLHGTDLNPIVIINDDGIVKMSNGFSFSNSTYFKVLGIGHDSTALGTRYGFVIDGNLGSVSGVGMTITGRSAHVEVGYYEVYKKGYGTWIKQDGSCADSLNTPNWILFDISMHHTWQHNINQDVVYGGNSFPNGTQTVMCNGVATHPIPMRLGQISFKYNILDSAGRSGLQLSGAETGFNEIAYNTVRGMGYEHTPDQGNGIDLGGHSYAWIHDNDVKYTYKEGIVTYGDGLTIMENNTVDSAGVLKDGTSNPGAWSALGTDNKGALVPSFYGQQIIIRNNTVGWCTADTAGVSRGVPSYGRIKISDNSHTLRFRNDNWIYGNTAIGATPQLLWVDPSITAVKTFFYTSLPSLHASAGLDSSYALPRDTVVLMGFGLNIPGQNITSYSWSKISGPSVTTTDLNSQLVKLYNLQAGTYTYRLTVTGSDGATATDDVVLTVTGSSGGGGSSGGNYIIKYRAHKAILISQ